MNHNWEAGAKIPWSDLVLRVFSSIFLFERPDLIFINLLGTFRLQWNEHLQGREKMQLNPPVKSQLEQSQQSEIASGSRAALWAS